METEDRWYVRFRGHTLGPLTSEQVKASVRGKELGPDDKVASTSNPTWRALRTQAEFLRCWESLQRPMPVELTPLPSPKVLWQKKRAPLPKAPAESRAAKAPETKPVKPGALSPAPVPAPAAAESEPEPKREPARARTAAASAKKTASKSRAKKKKTRSSRSGDGKKQSAAKASAKVEEPAALPESISDSTPPVQTRVQTEAPAEPQPAAPLAPASPAPNPALAAIPEKPSFAPAPEAAEVSNSPSPAAPFSAWAPPQPAAPHPKLAEETLSLLEALRDWNRREQSRLEEVKAAEAVKAQAPLSPLPVAVSIAEPKPEPSPAPAAVEAAKPKGIELRLNLTISKQFLFAFAAVSALALAAVVFTLSQTQKMRGPADSRLPDPSSPTTNPSAENDPIPQLKAPTRPKRD